MPQRKAKIVLCGHYGSTNVGDEAIGLGIIETLKGHKPDAEITVLSYNAKRSAKFYNQTVPAYGIKSAYLLPLGLRSLIRGIFKGELYKTIKIIKKCDHFIIGGGGLFTDEKLFAVFLWGIHAFIADIFGKSIYMIGQSVGPLNTKIGKWIVKKTFSKSKAIYVRDHESKKILKKIGVKNEINVSTDAAFGMKKSGKVDEGATVQKLNKKIEQEGWEGYFIISVREWDGKLDKLNKKIEQVCNRISKETRLKSVFVPFQVIKNNDRKALNKKIVQTDESEHIELINYTNNIWNIIEVISCANFVVGVRLHSLIFSIIANTPFVGIAYCKKINNFMESLELEDYIINKSLSEEDFYAKLYKKIHETLGDRDLIVKQLKNKNKQMRSKWNKSMEDFIKKTL